MKYIYTACFLFICISSNAQDVLDTSKVTYSWKAKNQVNNFILPAYSNSILDAEHFFSTSEIELLNRIIDSSYKKTKLNFQFAFVTKDYYENDSLRFDEFVDTLSSKWNPGVNTSRAILVLCMQQKQAVFKLLGNFSDGIFSTKLKNSVKFLKENHELNDSEKEDLNFISKMLNAIFTESNFVANIKSKNYVQAVEGIINAIINKKELFNN